MCRGGSALRQSGALHDRQRSAGDDIPHVNQSVADGYLTRCDSPPHQNPCSGEGYRQPSQVPSRQSERLPASA